MFKSAGDFVTFSMLLASLAVVSVSGKVQMMHKRRSDLPKFSRGDSKGEKIIKAYQYGQDLLDNEDDMVTVDQLLNNHSKKGSKKSYLCKDYDICTPTKDEACKGFINQCGQEEKYWELLAKAALQRVIELEYGNDKSAMNAEMYAKLMNGGGRGVGAHVRAAGSVVGEFVGLDTYRKALDKANGGGSSYFAELQKSRERKRDSKKQLDCDGEDEGSLRCENTQKTHSKIYDHVQSMSWRGSQALEIVEDLVEDL